MKAYVLITKTSVLIQLFTNPEHAILLPNGCIFLVAVRLCLADTYKIPTMWGQYCQICEVYKKCGLRLKP